MKKNYFSFLFAALMLFVAVPATAQVSGMSDLFGTYKFTATITPTAAGQEHTDLWEDECEVIITKGPNGAPAAVQGLMGASETQTVASIDTENNIFYVVNPNPNYGLWSGYIGVADMSLENLQLYTMEYHFDPDTKEITIPDFSICQFSWPAPDYNMAGEVLAEVTNVKLVLVEAEEIEIPEIEGEWQFKPYSMGYVRNDSTFAYEFTIDLVAKDDTKQLYDATFTIEGFEPFTLEATFNGVDLIMPFNNLYIDAEQKIRLGVKATTQEMTLIKEGQLSFSYSNSTLMWQGDYIVFRQDVITTEEVDGVVVEKESALTLQQITYGWLEREDPNAIDWAGIYTVTVGDLTDFYEEDGIDFPSTFEMEIVASAGGGYTVKKFAGYASEYYPSIGLTPGADGKSATLDLKGYYGFAILEYIGESDGDYAYHVLTDLYGESTTLNLTVNEDGTLNIEDFSVSHYLWYADEYDCLALMSDVTAEKYVEKFEWAGEYTLTATVESIDNTVAAPAEFDVKIEEKNGSFIISVFDGEQVYALNYGGIALDVTGDYTATFKSGSLVKGSYPMYVSIGGVDNADIEMTGDKEGNIQMSNFVYSAFDYNSFTSTPAANYSNVVLTKKVETDGIENIAAEKKPAVEGIFDFMGRKLDAITAPGLYIVNGKKVVVK